MYRIRWFSVLGCFWLHPAVCGILLPQLGVEPGPLAGIAQTLSLEFPKFSFSIFPEIQFLNLSWSWAFLFPAPRSFLSTFL